MSYNGIGLKTAKGSATSGHIQKSLADNGDSKNKSYHSRQKDKLRNVGKHSADNTSNNLVKRKATSLEFGKSIIEHISKREIEVQVSELRDALEDADEEESIITEKCNKLRQELLNAWEAQQRLDKAYKSRAKRSIENSQVD